MLRYRLLALVVALLYCYARGEEFVLRCDQDVYNVEEGGSVLVCISVEALNRRLVTVQIDTIDETAIGGLDFSPVVDNTIELDDSINRCRQIEAFTDNEYEGEENFTVMLTSSESLPGSCEVVISDRTGPQVGCFAGDTIGRNLSALDEFSDDFCMFPFEPLQPGVAEFCDSIELADCTRWNDATYREVQSVASIEDYLAPTFANDSNCNTAVVDTLEFLFSQRGGSCLTNCVLAVLGDLCSVSYVLLDDVMLDADTMTEARTITADCSLFMRCCPCSLGFEPTDLDQTSTQQAVIAGAAVGASLAGLIILVLVIVGITLLVLLRRRRHQTPHVENKNGTARAVVYKPKKSSSDTNESALANPVYVKKVEDPSQYMEVTHTTDTRTYQEWRKIFASFVKDPSLLHFGELLGEGAFGKVYKGKLKTASGRSMDVAIKTLKNVTSPADQEIEDFLSESALMLNMDHPNVMKLIGICFDTKELLPVIMLPFMENGDLRAYLQSKRTNGASNTVEVYPEGLNEAILMGMCYNIASGMEYLARSKFVHRDLAARNCMVDANLSVKVADFGLSRDLYHSDYYRLTHSAKLPVKWMSPESLYDNVFNEKTDIWSFGVVCWEIFSLGRKPYPGVDNADIPEYISNQHRLKKPALCPDELYGVMQATWSLEPEERPNFSQLLQSIFEIGEFEPDKQEDGHGYFVLDRKSITTLSNDAVEQENLYSEVDYSNVVGNGAVTPAQEYEVPTASVHELDASSSTLNTFSEYETPVSSTAALNNTSTDVCHNEHTYHILEPQQRS